MSNGKNHNKTIIFLCIICVAFSLWNGYNISKKTEMFSYIRFTMYAKETLFMQKHFAMYAKRTLLIQKRFTMYAKETLFIKSLCLYAKAFLLRRKYETKWYVLYY